MISLCKNVWMLSYPLRRLGWDIRRNVTIIKLASGRLIMHSTGPFAPDDIRDIKDLGTVTWIVEAMLRHDTFSATGQSLFPDAAFLAPEGFSKHVDFFTHSIVPTPYEWRGQFEVLELAGIPSMRENVCFHVPSRTLIVADLIFNFPHHEPLWSELMLKAAVQGVHRAGLSRAFKLAIRDEVAFRESVAQMMRWNFDRVVVGHGELIESGAHEKVFLALREAGYAPDSVHR
jgi:hypothetical protein